MSDRHEGWWEALQRHKDDNYAHGSTRGDYETRLRVLEQFKAQATLLGAIGFTLLGALTVAVIERFLAHGIP